MKITPTAVNTMQLLHRRIPLRRHPCQLLPQLAHDGEGFGVDGGLLCNNSTHRLANRFKTATEKVCVRRLRCARPMCTVLFIPVCTLSTPSNRRRGATVPVRKCFLLRIMCPSNSMALCTLSSVSCLESLRGILPPHMSNLRIDATTQRAVQHNTPPRALLLRLPVTQQGAAF